ncbi:MAG: histidine kinase [Bacteroidetes bacterium]|nr:histidine kinase [Bacteroidota bacterium]
MMKKIVLITLLLFGFLCTKAQTSTRKSLESQSGDKYSSLIDSANVCINKQPAKAIKFLEEALLLASEQKGDYRSKECYQLLGKANYNLKLYSQSLRFYEKAKGDEESFKSDALNSKNSVVVSEKKSEEKVLTKKKNIIRNSSAADAEILKGQALNYEGLNDDKMLEYTLSQLENMATTADAKAWVNNARGRMAFKNKDYQTAISYFKKVSSLEKVISSKILVAEANDYLGRIYSLQNNKAAAKTFYKISAENAAGANDDNLEYEQNIKLKEEYKSDKEFDKVLKLNKSIAEKTANDTIRNQILLENASVYLEQNKPDKAIAIAQQSIGNTSASSVEVQAEAYKILSKAYEKKGDFEKAFENHETYVDLMDSVHKKRESEITTDLYDNTQVSESNQRIELLEKNKELSDRMIMQLDSERKFQEALIYGLVIFILIVVVSAYLLYKNIKQKKIANQLLALKSLRSQMNPHFIFNALNSVNSFISSNDQKTANKYLADFSKLMRSVLENSQKDFVPLSEEVEVLRLYLKLEHFRFSNKFDYTFEVDENLVVEQYKVPPMLIQPYIENSVWHGLRYKEEKGMLDVRVAGSGDSLTVTITDNGIGRKKSQELKTHNQKQNESMGLKNIESRLQIINDLFKTNLKVQVQDANPKTGEGTIVNISIPFQKE